MKTILALLLAAASLPAQTPLAHVTFFREGQSMMKQMGQFKEDFVGAGVHWKIYINGVQYVTLHRNRMVTFSLPVGHYDFKTDRSDRLSLDVQAGTYLFIRPGIGGRGLKAKNTFLVVNCSTFIPVTSKIKSVNPTDVFTGTVIPETSFSKLCNSLLETKGRK